MELDIMNNVMEEKSFIYESKSIQGYRRGKNLQQLQKRQEINRDKDKWRV